ncbi:17527_t:CDS:2, partial [Gigaspora margarita]
MSLSKKTDYGTGHDFEEFIEELLNQNGIHANSHSVKPTRYKSDDDFKFHIENLLSGNRILVNSFNSRKDKIDIIATFNRQIILIHISNSSDVNTFKGLQTSICRFGEGIL